MDKGGPVDGRFRWEDPGVFSRFCGYATMCETIPETVASMPMDRELFHMLKSLVDQGRIQNPNFMGLEKGIRSKRGHFHPLDHP